MIDVCDPCLRRSLLIAHLAPRIAGLLTQRRGRRVAGLLALPEDELLAAAAGRRIGEALAFLESFDADAERERLDLPGALAVCCARPRLPGAARRARRPARRPLRSRAARRARGAPGRAGRGGGRHPPGEPVRRGGRLLARPRARRVGRAGGQRPGARHRRYGAPRLSRRSRPAAGGVGLRARRGLPAAAPFVARADTGRRRRAVGASARDGALPVGVPGPQPDHGRACADDGGGRGGAAERQPDHLRFRARPGPLRRRGARAA